MKKITTLMVMLVGCICSALAQTVATTATDPSNITDGYYVLLAKTGEGTKTDENGNFVYYNSSDSKVYYDAKGSNTSILGQSVESVDLFKYFFYVKNTNGKLTIQAWNTNTYWPSVGNPTKIPANYNPGRVSQISQSSSYNEFSISNVSGTWLSLSFPGSYYASWSSRNTTPTTDYVVLNNNQQVGYWDATNSANAQFQFYAVSDVPSADEIVSLTYNYTFNGESKATSPQARLAVIGRAYPGLDNVLPDFVVASKPNGTVKADDNGKTIEIVCTEELPFQTSTDANPIYYYLENVQGTRLYANGRSLAFRTPEKTTPTTDVNGVRNDLWYVTGNVFDGFKLRNVNSGTEAQSEAMMSHVTKLTLSATSYSSTWDLFKSGEQFGVCAHPGTSYYDGLFRTIDESVKKNYSWSIDANANGIGFQAYEAGNDAFSFRLVPATFTFPMFPVEADGNTYNTFAAPFAVALDDEENEVKMYKGVVDTEKKELELSEVNAVPANAGVMLMGMGNQAEFVTFKVIADADAPALENNDLVGTTVELAAADLADKLILGISDETQEVGFFSINDDVATLTANHAYLNKTNSAVQTLSVRLAGQPTGIGQISVDTNKVTSDAPIFDLTGRRVNHTVKGQLYIQNGRKFIAQ